VRDPVKVVDEIETLVRDHGVGFFILADEEPTIHKKKFVQFCEELERRKLPVLWGINTRVTDILRDEALLPIVPPRRPDSRFARHRGGGAAEAGRFNKETTIAQNRRRSSCCAPTVSSPRRSSSSAWRTRRARRSRNLPHGPGLEA